MKKTLLTTLMVALAFFAFSQSNKEEIDLVQSVFGMEKKAMAAEFIKLEGAPKDAFWVAYDEYETKRKELGKKRIELLEQIRRRLFHFGRRQHGANNQRNNQFAGGNR